MPLGDDPVDVIVSAARRAPVVESFPAAVQSERTAEIATRMSGNVERVLVDVGSSVRAGQTLLVLDAADVVARVASARAGAELAEHSHRRMAALAADGAASQHELDQATAALGTARAMLAEAEAQQAYAVVKAPFAGVITHRAVDPGDLAGPGRPLVTLVAPGALKVVANLPAHRAGDIHVGDEVRVRLPDGGTLDAIVTRSVPALGAGSRTFRVEAALDGAPAGLVPGAYVRMEIRRAGAGPRWLPSDAVVRRGQLTGVYALEGEELRLRWVRLGQERDGAVELLAGPAGDLTVVRRPAADLFDGRSVSAARTEAFDLAAGTADVGADAVTHARSAAASEEVDG
jgi:RND family efflux transporter MFP subunit